MLTWHTKDKSSWGEGPWMEEPDKAQWIGEAELDCLIVRGPSGALCGYVGVPESHPFFGKDYNAVDTVDVHGGLTFSDKCHPTEDPAKHICHIGELAANKEVWLLGFDCAHSGDYCPDCGMRFGIRGFEQYRNFNYVQREVEVLGWQLKLAAGPA